MAGYPAKPVSGSYLVGAGMEQKGKKVEPEPN